MDDFYQDVLYMGKVGLEEDICKPHCVETYYKVGTATYKLWSKYWRISI